MGRWEEIDLRGSLASLLVILLAALAGGGAAAGKTLEELTTPESSIEVGFLYNSEDSFEYGDYTGLTDKGADFLGNVDIRRKGTWDSGDTRSWRLRGLNLGLDSRFADFEYWDQGLFRFFVLYDNLPKFQTESGTFPFLDLGSTNLTLPAGWVPGDQPADMTELESSLRPFGIEHERETLATGLSVDLFENFALDLKFDRQTKKGNKLVGAVIGNSGGNPRAVTIPEPVNYLTHDYNVSVAYRGDGFQGEVGYYAQSFESKDDYFTWQNPYTVPERGGIPQWNPVAGYDTGFGRKSIAPDNWFHQLRAAGGLSLPMKTRVAATAAFGWMLQDEDYLAFTVNPGLAVTTPLGRSDLDGYARTTMINFRVTSTPVKILSLRGEYTYDERDNDSSRDTYIYVPGDSQDQGLITDSTARRNRPYSFTQHHVVLEGRVHSLPFLSRTHGTLGYEWKRQERDFQEVDQLDDHLIRLGLRTRLTKMLSAGAKYEYSRRDGSGYNGIASLAAGSSIPHLVDIGFDPTLDPVDQWNAGLWENHPLLRKYYLADRNRNLLKFFGNLTALGGLDLGANVKWVRDDYDNTTVGLTERERLSFTLDVSYAPTERMSTYAFYTYEQIRDDQNGWSFTASGPPGTNVTQSQDPARRWNAEDEDTVHTVGLGGSVSVIENRFTVGADFLYTESDEGLSAFRGPTLVAGGPVGLPFPNSKIELWDLSIHGEYAVKEDLKLRLGYLYEHFGSNDWAVDGIAPDTLEDVIAAGVDSPEYRAHLVSASVILEFY